ncbi:MAG TPA: LuxR C-terminal-related transcriptional regulator [Spirochaetota bacterium]|nr:LuxR C-terminal-related transcriptional regulator [Spirochaetota bacterium]
MATLSFVMVVLSCIGFTGLLFSALWWVISKKDFFKYYTVVLGIVTLHILVTALSGWGGVKIAVLEMGLSVIVLSTFAYVFFLFVQTFVTLNNGICRRRKVVLTVSLFLIPQLVFSSSPLTLRIERIGESLFSASLAIFSAVLLLYIIASRFRDVKKRPNLVFGLLVSAGLVSLIIGILIDRWGEYGRFLSGFSLSVGAYSFLGIVTILTIFYAGSKLTEESKKSLLRYLGSHGISKREKDIVELIVSGRSNNEIADKLYISLSTVKSHLYSIYRKLDISSRMELLSAARDRLDGRGAF